MGSLTLLESDQRHYHYAEPAMLKVIYCLPYCESEQPGIME